MRLPFSGRRDQDGGAARVARKDRTGVSPLKAGAFLILAIITLTYFGFSKDIPFTHGYRLKAVFESANSIRPASPVRIAGVNVGKVKKVERAGSSDAALVTLELDKSALPIHKDATLKIRPRIFLEGNFFVDLRPGTPSAPTLESDDTIPMTQTSSPVQLDEVLTALQSDARQDLQDVLAGYGGALAFHPTTLADRGQDPDVRGERAARSLNDTFKYSPDALKNMAIVNNALLGTEPKDLSKLIASFGRVAEALDRNEVQLQDLITNFNTTTAALASEQTNLRRSIRLLAPTLRTANRLFTNLNRAFPPTRAFAREILPGVRQTPATINAAFPWMYQTRRLLGPLELRGLARELAPTTAALARFTDQTLRLLPQVDRIARCLTQVILPTGDVVINDGALSTGYPNYKEFWHSMVALAGEGQNFDGNGMYVRFQPGGGPFTVATGQTSNGGESLFGNAAARPIGTRPKYPGRRPPYRPDVVCAGQPIPDLNGPAAEVGPAPSTQSRSTSRTAAPAAVARAQGAQAKREEPSVADELAKRLNPFATPGRTPERRP